MKKGIFILFNTLLTMVFSSCVELSDDLDSLSYEPQIVVEGLIVNEAGKSFVKVSMTSPNGDSVNDYLINNASVIVVENDIITDTFKLVTPGYYADSAFSGKINSIYTLIVKYNETEYTSVSPLLPVTTIDSLVYKVADSISATDIQYNVYAYAARTSADSTSYYKINFYRNDSLFNSYADILIMSDVLFESFNNLELPYIYQSGDKVKVEIYSITRQVYDYYDEVLNLSQGNLNAIYFYPQNPQTNISNGALGVFQTSSVSSTEIVLP